MVISLRQFRLGLRCVAVLLGPCLSASVVYTPYSFTTIAGIRGSANGPGSQVELAEPEGMAQDAAGDVFVAASTRVVKISPSGEVSTLAGQAGVGGNLDGAGIGARFGFIRGLAIDARGNLYAGDNGAIRKISSEGFVTTLAGVPGIFGHTDGTGPAAQFGDIEGIAADPLGNLYATDSGTVRKITPGGVVTTLAGTPNVIGSADGVGSAAQFGYPQGIAVDQDGNVYVADSTGSTIRKITPAGLVSTFAGSANMPGTQDGQGTNARFMLPFLAGI